MAKHACYLVTGHPLPAGGRGEAWEGSGRFWDAISGGIQAAHDGGYSKLKCAILPSHGWPVILPRCSRHKHI